MKSSFSKENDKILIISNMYPSKKDPIYGNFVQEQEVFLKKKGFQTIVSKITERDGNVFQKIWKYVKLFFHSFIKALDPKVKIIHYHFEYPTALFSPFFKFILRKKIFITVHGPQVLTHTGFKKKLIKLFFASSDYVIGVSDYLKRSLEETYHLSPTKVLSIHCGVNTDLFYPSKKMDERGKLGLPDNKTIILYIGRIHNEKGMETVTSIIPEMVKENPGFYFLFVGNGPHTHHFKQLELDYPDNFEYRVGVSKEIVPSYFNASDLFVFPTQMETFGLVALEALACETPVVASKVGGVPEIIEDEVRGFLFENGNELELKKKIELAFSTNAMKRSKMKEDGLDFAQKNTVESQIEKLITFY